MTAAETHWVGVALVGLWCQLSLPFQFFILGADWVVLWCGRKPNTRCVGSWKGLHCRLRPASVWTKLMMMCGELGDSWERLFCELRWAGTNAGLGTLWSHNFSWGDLTRNQTNDLLVQRLEPHQPGSPDSSLLHYGCGNSLFCIFAPLPFLWLLLYILNYRTCIRLVFSCFSMVVVL